MPRIEAPSDASGPSRSSAEIPIDGYFRRKAAASDTLRMVMTLLSGIAEFEREMIGNRTSAGRVAAKLKGVKFGRPEKQDGAKAANCETGARGQTGERT